MTENKNSYIIPLPFPFMEEEGKKSRLVFVLSFMFVIFVIGVLFLYWIVPFQEIDFTKKYSHSNFSVWENEQMQFYEKMRFPEPEISYKISDCLLQKQDEMKQAFEIISDLTVLEFFEVEENPEISVTCDEKNKIDGGLFIAGEGGPTNITMTDNFNVILHGKILLIKPSNCAKPNVAVHELLHVLGFGHSQNKNNIMYNFSRCNQELGDDVIKLINDLYSTKSLSDLKLENASATLNGKYLDANIIIRNHGLKKSEKSKLIIYVDDKNIKEVELDEIKIGYGMTLVLSNVDMKKSSPEKIEVVIEYDFDELDKINNKLFLKK